MGYIYKIYNDINDKVYIGQTTQTIEIRWSAHLSMVETSDRHLYLAMRKYGAEKFHIECVEECDNDMLDDREIYWIWFYSSYESGYNETLGGDGNRKYDPDIFIELWNYGLSCNEIAEEIGCSPPTVRCWLRVNGISKEETISRRAAKQHKKVFQYDLNGNLLRVFNGVLDAKAFLGYKSGGAVSNAIKFHYDVNGTLLVLEDDIDNVQKYIDEQKYRQNRKPVLQYTTDGVLVAYHYMVKNAAKAIDGTENGIINACKHISTSYKNFLWKYDTDNTDIQELIERYNNVKIIGVYLDKRSNKWYAKICVNYVKMSLGYFHTKEEAITARLKAENKYFGDSAQQKHLFEQYGIT